LKKYILRGGVDGPVASFKVNSSGSSDNNDEKKKKKTLIFVLPPNTRTPSIAARPTPSRLRQGKTSEHN
jgi:hypothetical protein